MKSLLFVIDYSPGASSGAPSSAGGAPSAGGASGAGAVGGTPSGAGASGAPAGASSPGVSSLSGSSEPHPQTLHIVLFLGYLISATFLYIRINSI